MFAANNIEKFDSWLNVKLASHTDTVEELLSAVVTHTQTTIIAVASFIIFIF